MAMARMRRVCLASAVRAAAARNCEILRFWRVISIADMLPAPRINDVLHRVTLAAVWESPQESGSQAVGIIGDHDPAFRQQILDVAEAQREPNIEPDRVLDDFGRKAIAAIADFDHRGWYGYRSVTARPPPT